MKSLLSRENADLLAQLAWSRVLLAFDFDGTLAPVVALPAEARMRKRTAVLLAKVCSVYPCAVLSGRGRRDLASRLAGARVKYVVGNHGLAPGLRMQDFAEEVARARAHLETSLAGWPGVDIEDRGSSLALHYRRSRQKRLARAAIDGAVAALPLRMRLVPGKLVVNVVPEGAPYRGDAITALRTTAQADTVLYVGDDATDEDVFALDQPGRLSTVRMGVSRSSAAAWFLRDQTAIDLLLEKLVALREEHSPR